MVTLGFSTHFPWGEPTEFIPKIWAGLIGNNIADWQTYDRFFSDATDCSDLVRKTFLLGAGVSASVPKVHTFREDVNNLWHAGRKIHPVIFNRTKNRFQFAPVLECVSVQKIQIVQCEVLKDGKYKQIGEIYIDNKYIEPCMYRTIALNDGFAGTKQFFQYFNRNWSGKIIHFTSLKY